MADRPGNGMAVVTGKLGTTDTAGYIQHRVKGRRVGQKHFARKQVESEADKVVFDFALIVGQQRGAAAQCFETGLPDFAASE